MSNLFRLEEQFSQADLDIKDGYYEAAFQKLENILVEEPTFGKAYNHMGWMYETKFRNYQKAEEFYQRALDCSPEYSPIYTNYSILLSTLGKFDKLEMLIEKGLTVAGVDKANLYNEKGIMREQQGRFNEAIEAYRTCAQLTLSNDTLNRAKDSIARCENKKTL